MIQNTQFIDWLAFGADATALSDGEFHEVWLGRRLINAQPQAHWGELDHGKEVGGELVVARGNAAEVLQLREEALDQVALAVKPLAKARLPLAVRLAWDVGCGTLPLDKGADAVGSYRLIHVVNHAR